MHAPPPRWLLPLLLVLFFASGVCALVYQVMWLRLLSLVFGVTVYAASTVLAGFMAGLGVGSFVAGRLASRIRRPLVAFGIAEALVGVTAFATPFLLDALTAVWIDDSSGAAAVARDRDGDSLHRRVPAADRADVADGRDAAAGDQVGGGPRRARRRPHRPALRDQHRRRDRRRAVAGFYFISEIGVARSFQIAAATNILICDRGDRGAGYAMPATIDRRQPARRS